MPSAEFLLFAGALALYAYDVALAIYADEMLLWQSAKAWKFSIGGSTIVSGRYLIFPAALDPGAPVFRGEWTEADDAGRITRYEIVLSLIRPLRWHAWFLAFCLLVLIPTGFMVNLSPALMVLVLVVIYGSTAFALVYLARHRDAFQISKRALGEIAFDVLACPPFALNLVRRVTLKCDSLGPIGDFARNVLPTEEVSKLGSSIDRRRQMLDFAADVGNQDAGDR